MKIYKRFIKPMKLVPTSSQDYTPKEIPIEAEEKWYPEEVQEYLEKKYDFLNKMPFCNLVFEEKYEPYDDFTLLKEQEAKPILNGFQRKDINVKFGDCPKCNASLDDRQYPYSCGFCGQKVQWDD